ncbi:dUTP diphosphatase [Haloimpatiens sp. FM7315]|uniref:dUTP diphosphatase n=1 Tax=Haloimpatiens sp. FM7315 TaxID=3298609 RepID=UPI0035A2BD85
MKLLVERTNEKAIMPFKAHEDDAGMDLFSIEEITINPMERKLIHTGIKIQLPKNTEAQIRPRSGLALKNGITVLNTPGTIDEGYRGEIGVILINLSDKKFKVEEGMKIAQMVIKPILSLDVEEVFELTETRRGQCGFGSTGILHK